jgi:hypothetical protein
VKVGGYNFLGETFGQSSGTGTPQIHPVEVVHSPPVPFSLDTFTRSTARKGPPLISRNVPKMIVATQATRWPATTSQSLSLCSSTSGNHVRGGRTTKKSGSSRRTTPPLQRCLPPAELALQHRFRARGRRKKEVNQTGLTARTQDNSPRDLCTEYAKMH